MILIVIAFILILLFLLLKSNENFTVPIVCKDSKKVNEINYGKETDIKLSIVPNKPDIPEGKGIKPKEKKEEKEKNIDMKEVIYSCDGKTKKYYGFKPEDIKTIEGIDTSVIDSINGFDIVDPLKLIPLLFNEVKKLLYYNFGHCPAGQKATHFIVKDNEEDKPVCKDGDEGTLYNDLNNRIKKADIKINKLHSFLKKKVGLDGSKGSCTQDIECNGGPSKNVQKGECVNGFCECKSGYIGKYCDVKDTSDEALVKRGGESINSIDKSCVEDSDCPANEKCQYTKCVEKFTIN